MKKLHILTTTAALAIAVLAVTALFSACAHSGANNNGPEVELLRAEFALSDQVEQSLNEMKDMIEGLGSDCIVDMDAYVTVYNVDEGVFFALVPIYDKTHSEIISVGDCTLEGDVLISADTNAICAIRDLPEGNQYVLFVTGARYYASSATETTMLYQMFNDDLIVQFQINEEFRDSSFDEKITKMKEITTADFTSIRF